MTLVSPGIGSVAHFIGLVLAQSAAMLLGLPVYIFLKNRTLNLPRQWQQLIFAVFVVVWSGLNTLLWQQTRSRTILDIRLIAGFMNWGLLNLLVAFGVFAVGWIAYEGKKAHQFRYGVIEILVAMVTAMISASGIDFAKPDTFTRVATIIGCVYIVSRGLENMAKYDVQKAT
jgi:hypothetical protein